MTQDKFDLSNLEPDIVTLILQKVIAMSPGFSAALARQIEAEIKEQHGGQRLFVPKGAKRKTPEQLKAAYKDGLTSMSNADIMAKHNIAKRSLYRLMKQGGGRFGD